MIFVVPKFDSLVLRQGIPLKLVFQQYIIYEIYINIFIIHIVFSSKLITSHLHFLHSGAFVLPSPISLYI
jgi:hypothetical protein